MVIVIVNTLLIVALLLWEKMRELQFGIIFIHAVVDFVGCGVGGVWLYISSVSPGQLWAADYVGVHGAVDVSLSFLLSLGDMEYKSGQEKRQFLQDRFRIPQISVCITFQRF